MIGNVGGGNDLLAFLQARTANTRAATGKPQTAKEDEAIKALQENQQRTADLLRSLTQAADDMKRQRKAAAQEKVERLKKELELLRRFGGDPKAVARQAAAIARELASAAKDYAAAGAGIASGNDAIAAAPATQGEVPAEAKAGPSGQDQPHTDPAGTAKVLTSQEVRAALEETFNAAASENQRKASEAEADTKFKNLVRTLLSQAKAMIEQQRLRTAAGSRDDKDIKKLAGDVAEAGKDIEQAFSSGGMLPGLITAEAPVSISV